MEKKDFVAGQLAKLQTGFQEMVGGLLDEAVEFGAASVVIPEAPPVLSDDASEQEKIDAAVAQVRSEMQGQLDLLRGELDSKQADLEKALADDASDKAEIEAGRKALAESKGMIDAIEAILHRSTPAPVESQGE